MPWKCRLVTEDELKTTPQSQRVGLMWYAPKMVEIDPDDPHSTFFLDHVLSPEYKRDHLGKRPPVFVVLPSGDWFCPDQKVSRGDHGWTVTGEPPTITVAPSINDVGRYHGWLRDGELSDDVEGRLY